MSDTTEQAAAPAEVEVINDGIIDLDAAPAAEEPSPDDEAEKPAEEAKKAEPEAGETEEAKKKLSGAQRAKLREQRLRDELSARERQIEELRKQTKASDAGADDGEKEPVEADFNGDWFAYRDAVAAFKAGKAAREAIRNEFRTKEQAELSTKQTEAARARAEAHAERIEDAREVIADFDEVMETMKGVQVRQDVIDEIMSSDKSALLSYHLAKNPEKLDALNSMNARELAREMGRLEATVALPEAKKQTSAPPPLTALKGGASPSSAESDLNAWLKKTYGK
jgi:hypothetical protein